MSAASAGRWLRGPHLLVAVAGAWTMALRPVPPAIGWALVACGIAVFAAGRGRPAGAVAVAIGAVALHAGVAHATASGGAASVEVAGSAVLVSDPVGSAGSASAAIEIDGVRYQATAAGALGRPLRAMQAGERVQVQGRTRALDAEDAWLADRHVVARLDVRGLDGWSPASGPLGWANRFRSLLWSGASSLDDAERALFAGLVTGDDRALAALDSDAFTAAGLTHLTAVSGQNVAFVLVVVHPALRWLPARWRTAAVLATLGGVVLVTRAEPSVLRAVVMAGTATVAVGAGRRSSGLRTLGLAVVVLLMIDPLLAGRPGFVLSVVASGGILVGARRIAASMRGPRALRDGLSVTLAAQVATAPVLAAVFGSVPLVALPANLVAVPIAGWVMVYGLAAGVVAGVAGRIGLGSVAAAAHRPTGVAIGWLQGIADLAARAPDRPLGPMASAVVAVGAAALLVGAAGDGRGGRAVRRAGGALVAATLVGVVAGVPALGPAGAPGGELVGASAGPGASVWRRASAPSADAGVVVVDGRADPVRVLGALRRYGIRTVGVLVVRSASPGASAAGDAVARRFDVAQVLRPGGGPMPPWSATVDGWLVEVRPQGDGPWTVEVIASGPASPVGSPGPSG